MIHVAANHSIEESSGSDEEDEFELITEEEMDILEGMPDAPSEHWDVANSFFAVAYESVSDSSSLDPTLPGPQIFDSQSCMRLLVNPCHECSRLFAQDRIVNLHSFTAFFITLTTLLTRFVCRQMDHFSMSLVLVPSCFQRRVLLHASRFRMSTC